jgi:hypothetical protein
VVSNQQLPHPQLLSMKDTEKALKEELSPNFNGHGQRLNMMSKLVLAVLKMCTVNFAELSQVINAAVKVESNFKRIQRFMKGYSFCQRCFVQFAWSFYGTQGDWVALSMDSNQLEVWSAQLKSSLLVFPGGELPFHRVPIYNF